MAVHWQITFRGVRSNRQYNVNIYDNAYTGDAILLRGAANPFVTDENNDDDWFLPVRTQSGYIRIVDDGYDLDGDPFDWKDLLPATDTSRPVTLTDNFGTVRWRGYIQPRTFSGRLYEDTQEREFPVMCALSVLAGVDVDTTARGVVTFASLLDYILTQTGWRWEKVGFQGTDAHTWLLKKVDWENFIKIDSDNTRQPRYNCMEILTEMCKFWGWTARTFQEEIWFVSPDDSFYPAFEYFTDNDWTAFISSGTVNTTTRSYTAVDYDDDIYVSTNNQVEILRGIRRATINADINKQELITEVPFSEITDEVRTGTVTETQYGADGHHYLLYQSDASRTMTFEDTVLSVVKYGNSHGIIMVEEYYEGDVTYKHNYDWTPIIQASGNLVGTIYESNYLVSISSVHPHNYDHGMLVVSGSLSQVFVEGGERKEYNATGHLICRLRVGNNWWDGQGWGQKSTFQMLIGNEDGTTAVGNGKIVDTRVLNGPYNAYEGYGAPIGSAIGGVVEFQIVGVVLDDDHGFDNSVDISSLTIEFVRMKSYTDYSERSYNEYTADSNAAFSDERNVSLIFASDNANAFGIGVIMNADGSYCSSVSYSLSGGAFTERPEEHLLNRMVARGAETKYKEYIEIDAEPSPTYICETVNMTGYPMAVGHDWADDKVRILILEQ